MSIAEEPIRILEEIADLLTSNPTHEQLLEFHPSQDVQKRAGELLYKQNAGTITPDEQRELNQFEQAELLMRLVKARLNR